MGYHTPLNKFLGDIIPLLDFCGYHTPLNKFLRGIRHPETNFEFQYLCDFETEYEYLCEFETEFEHNLEYDSGVHMGLIHEKKKAENLVLLSL
jgi:hypothetical protein